MGAGCGISVPRLALAEVPASTLCRRQPEPSVIQITSNSSGHFASLALRGTFTVTWSSTGTTDDVDYVVQGDFGEGNWLKISDIFAGTGNVVDGQITLIRLPFLTDFRLLATCVSGGEETVLETFAAP